MCSNNRNHRQYKESMTHKGNKQYLQGNVNTGRSQFDGSGLLFHNRSSVSDLWYGNLGNRT